MHPASRYWMALASCRGAGWLASVCLGLALAYGVPAGSVAAARRAHAPRIGDATTLGADAVNGAIRAATGQPRLGTEAVVGAPGAPPASPRALGLRTTTGATDVLAHRMSLGAFVSFTLYLALLVGPIVQVVYGRGSVP